MKLQLAVAFMILLIAGCHSQNSVVTNEIIRTKAHRFGVVSKSGKLLIDSIYGSIRILNGNERLTLPPINKPLAPQPTAYYSVRDTNNQWAIFDSDGEKVFDFIACQQLQFDENTATVVAVKQTADNGTRSSLYRLTGELIFERNFENIGYINGSDLIALIAEDGADEEYYLFDLKTNVKLGPYTHFNVFNKDLTPQFGIEEQALEKYRNLNLITVRTTVGNDYIWQVIDLEGKEVLPMQYQYFRMIDKQMQDTYIARSKKPAGVDFLFYSRRSSETSQLLFFDQAMNEYEYVRFENYQGEIKKVER